MSKFEITKYNLFFPPIFKTIIYYFLIPSLLIIIFYEFCFYKIPSANEIIYKLGIIISKISYSILASTIFYIVTQYIGVFKPKFQKKIKIFPLIKSKTNNIDNNIQNLINTIGLSKININDFDKLDNHLKNINTDLPVGFNVNWYIYLAKLKIEILEDIKPLIIYHEYINDDIFIELNLIDAQLKVPYIFEGYKIHAISNLTYATLVIQEIIIHNQILQELINREYQYVKKYIDKNVKEYRNKNFN